LERQYFKFVVHKIEKFIGRAPDNHKISGLYLIDAVIKAGKRALTVTKKNQSVADSTRRLFTAHAKLGASNPYEARFAANIAASVRQCQAATDGPKERDALRKIIRLWREAAFFSENMNELASIVDIDAGDGAAMPSQQPQLQTQAQQFPMQYPAQQQGPPYHDMQQQQQYHQQQQQQQYPPQQGRMMMPPLGGPPSGYGYPPQQHPYQQQQQFHQQQQPYQQQQQQQQQHPSQHGFGPRGGPPQQRRGPPGAFDYDYGDNMTDADRVEQQRLRRMADEQRVNDPNAGAFGGPPPQGAGAPRNDLTSALSMLATGLAAAAANNNAPPPQQGGPHGGFVQQQPPQQQPPQQQQQQQQFYNGGHHNNFPNNNSGVNGNAGGFRGGPGGHGGPGGGGGPGGPGGFRPRTEGDLATSTTLFVGNVGNETNESDLRTIFSTFGDVVRLSLRSDKHCAFITFRLREQADSARTTMDGFKVSAESRGLALGWAPGRDEDRLAVARAQAEVMARELQESANNMQSTASELAGFDVHQQMPPTPAFAAPTGVPQDPFAVPTTPVVAAAPPPTWTAQAPPVQHQPPPVAVPVAAATPSASASAEAEERRQMLQAQFERRSAMRDQMTNRGPSVPQRGFQQQQQQQHQRAPPPTDMGPPPPRYLGRPSSPVRGRSRSPQPRDVVPSHAATTAAASVPIALPVPVPVPVPAVQVQVQTKPQDVDNQLLDDIYGE
jgi:RNA recognition motif-containing protein